MIFKEIHIDGFGIFNNFSLTLLKQGINIILGENEAGKSTLLKFLRYTLFGYPKSTDQRMAPLNGGEHKGRIKAILSDKKVVTFERIAGSSGGNINLLYDGRSIEDQDLWGQLLGNATKEIFENVYAFSLDELTGWDQLSASGVEDKIFSVGLGLRNISISDVEGTIQKQSDDIYKPRGTVQKIPLLLKEINSGKMRIQGIQFNLPKYQELSLDIEHLEAEIDKFKAELKKDESKSEMLDNYLKCYNSFIHIVNCDKELELLPELKEYPEDGIKQIEDLEKEENELNEKIQILKYGNEEEQGIEELEKEISSISFNSEILESEDKVEYLATNMEKYRQAKNDNEEDGIAIENRNKLIKEELDKISSKWTEDFVTDFSDMISRHDRINDFKIKFNEIKENKLNLEGQLKVMQGKESTVNTKNLLMLISIIFFIGSITALYYSLYVFSASLLLIAFLNFFGRKLFSIDKSPGNIEHQLAQLKNLEGKTIIEYESYLTNLNLDKSLTTDSVLEIFRTINEVKRLISDRNELKRKQQEQRIPFINKFEVEAISLRNLLVIKEPAENTEIFVNQILNEFNTAKEQSRYKEDLQKKLDSKKIELGRTEIKLGNINKKLADLLKSVNAGDREDFMKKYEENHKVKKLVEDRKNAVMNIEDIKKEKNDLDDKTELNELELKNKNTELGEKKNELKRIEGESELAEVMTGLESERQKLHNAYKDWMAGKIAVKLLTDVKSKYEKEKQPEVVKNSNNYFSKITGQRYKRINVSLEEKEVTVFDAREVSKKIEQLSRGTREQLLLSLRLGFIEEYERKAEPLPVIVDEVLVNFDPGRAKRTAEVLHEFGKNRQILIFTCHPETVEYFKPKDINQININDSG
jgi:uncharacterized protein YhaN